ncbi:MAG: hypothetical protein HWE22_04830 [Flavobacteriales bacterium]|nr:hypothetical protein [Flavobacteriales bacterium]
MEVLVLKTNVTSKQKAEQLRAVFDNHQSIEKWSVDIEDCDKVLRIEAQNGFGIKEAVALMQLQGFYGNELED